MAEIWKDIKGYEGLYMVSNEGRVKSLRPGSRIRSEDGTLYPTINDIGYVIVTLYNGKNRKKHTVHRLVAEAFIENPENKQIINHKDENKTNNRAENLEWCDYRYNNNYGTARQRALFTKYKPVGMYSTDGVLLAKFRSIPLAAEIMGVTGEAIHYSLHSSKGRACGYLWRYIDKKEFEIDT